MGNHFNDSPIENADGDLYGMSAFADAIANSILTIKRPVGTTLALNGPWGVGKSSTVNLIRAALAASNDTKLLVTDFKCWWYRGEEALALGFLQNLNSVLREGIGDKVKDLIPSVTQRLLQAGPVLGTAVSIASGNPWASLIPGLGSFAQTFFPGGATIEKTFGKLTKVLEDQERRFLVVIDDIDRLTPDEALAIFRLVKSVGRLPNVLYLLVFDRELAEKAVTERYPSEGPHFLEKIIQAGFEVPAPLRTDLNLAVLTEIESICGSPNEAQVVRFMNVFYDVVAPYMQTPRHIVRFRNALAVTWPAIGHELNMADFVAMETLRLYEPGLFKAIRDNKDEACGTRDLLQRDFNADRRFDPFLEGVPEPRYELAKTALQRLFPKLEGMGYTGSWTQQWDAERRICVGTHFDTYFRLALTDDVLSTKMIDELIRRANDSEFIKSTLTSAAGNCRRSGRSSVPVFLDELTTHAPRLEKSHVLPLLKALFEIHDEVDLKKDAGNSFNGDVRTTWRFYWLMRRLLDGRFSQAERNVLLLEAAKKSSLGWLVDMATSALDDHHEDPKRESASPEDRLVDKETALAFCQMALADIRAAAENGRLIRHADLLRILYSWRNFMDRDERDVRAWTDQQLKIDSSVVELARAFTGQSQSYGMGGFGALGDRVLTFTPLAHVDDDEQVLDAAAFRQRLEQLVKSETLQEGDCQTIRTLLGAWDRKGAKSESKIED